MKWIWPIAVVSIAIGCIDLIEPIVNLPYHVPRAYNEGWVAYWANAAVSRDATLYPPLNATISDNYPPGGFLIVGLLGRLVGDPIVAGRALCLVSFLVVALNIALWLRLNGVRKPVAVLSGAGFVMTLDALSHNVIGANDPEWFAHALVTTGLLLLWRDASSAARLSVSAALTVFGEWVKHLGISLPIALMIWLATSKRDALRRWLLVASAFAAVLLVATVAVWGPGFFPDVLDAPRRFSVGHALVAAYTVLPAILPILCLAALTIRKYRTSEAGRFSIRYLFVACFVAGIASCGEGVGENAFFDVAIAASLAAGLALEDMLSIVLSGQRLDKLSKAAVLVPAAICLAWTPFALRANVWRLNSLAQRIGQTPADIAFIESRGGHGAACENLALCFWSGVPFNLDFFNFGQKLQTQRIPLGVCEQLFDGTRYTLIQMYSVPRNSDSRLPAACNREITQNYQVVRQSMNGVFLLPRAVWFHRETARPPEPTH